MIGNEISTEEHHFKISCGDTVTAIRRIKERGLSQVVVRGIK